MTAILKKELKSYFMSPIGYVFVGTFLLINTFFFVSYQIAYSVADTKALFSNVNVIFLFLIAILTMRSLSEEKNKKTDQLLLTAPVKVSEIVLGKYLASFGVFLISLALSLMFPIILFIFGNPSFSECIGGYIGFILLWSALISVGIFISALTENQMISAIFTFSVLLLLSYTDTIAGSIENQLISGILIRLSLFGRYTDFTMGILDFSDVVFFISFTALFLFLTVKVVENRRYS